MSEEEKGTTNGVELQETTQKPDDNESKNDVQRLKSASNGDENTALTPKSDTTSNNDMRPPNENETSINKLRTYVRIEIVQSKWFEPLILLVICANCVFLALDNPARNSANFKELIMYIYLYIILYYILIY